MGAGAAVGGAGIALTDRIGAWMIELQVGQGPVIPAMEEGTVSFTPQAGQAKVRGSFTINVNDLGEFTKIRQSF